MPSSPIPAALCEDLALDVELCALAATENLGGRALEWCYRDDIAAFEADGPGYPRIADLAPAFSMGAPDILRSILLSLGTPLPPPIRSIFKLASM